MLESKQDKFFHHEITNVTNSGEKYLTTEAINFSLFIIIRISASKRFLTNGEAGCIILFTPSTIANKPTKILQALV